DQLWIVPSDGAAVALAGAAPGVVAPQFRFLGDTDLGTDGVAAVSGRGDACEVNDEGSTRCDLHLYVTDGTAPFEVEVSDNDLTDQNPRSPRTEVADGDAYFSFRGTGDESLLVRVRDG